MASEDSKKDPAWKYGYLANPAVPNNVTCKFCSKETKGGVFRHKQHLVGGYRNATVCPECPEDVKEEIREYMSKKKTEKEQMKNEEKSENGEKRIVRMGNSSNKKSRQVGMKPESFYEVKEEVELAPGNHFDGMKHVVPEVMTVQLVQHLLEPILEPLVRKVDKEEVKLALINLLNSMNQNGEKEVHISESRSLKLKFVSNLPLLVFTGARIEGEDCSNIQVALVDASTGQTVISGPESSAKVEIVVLKGDFDSDENGNWTVEEFKNNIVREREGKEPLLTGDANFFLKEGIGLVGEISFTDNSSWTRSFRFRLGARVVDNTDGTRVREAKTESFIVKDHSGESYKKHHPPSPFDEVCKKQVNLVLEDEEESENAIIGTRGKRIVRMGNSSTKKPRQVGPMDALCAPKSATQSRKGKQTTISDAFASIASCYEDKEEVKLALINLLNSMNQNGEKEVHISESRSLKLKFVNNLSLPVFTGARIEGEDCSNIQVALVDASTGQTVISGPESSAKVEIVVLEGNFDSDENDNWTVEEFKNNVVREREGKESLLTGDAIFFLKEGIGLVGEISFTDNSSWTRSFRFRLGARVVDNTDGTRVREAKTESFIVEDHSGESYKKHHPASLSDEVWKLENIGKYEALHKHLSWENIDTMMDFLTLFFMDAPRLQNILGTGMSAKMWEATVEHVQTCVLFKKVFLYCPSSSQQKTGVVFNVKGQVMGILSERQYVTIDKLSKTEKAVAHNLLISAFDHSGELVPFDDEASLVGSSSQLTNVLYTAGSPRTENSNGNKFLSSHKISGFDQNVNLENKYADLKKREKYKLFCILLILMLVCILKMKIGRVNAGSTVKLVGS